MPEGGTVERGGSTGPTPHQDAPHVMPPTRRAEPQGSDWDVLVAVMAGGAVGALARWAVGEALPWSGTGFPWSTFVENVSGGLALGVLMVFLLDVWPPRRYLRPFLGVGVLGGYTTFSAYLLDAHDLLVSGQEATALLYLGGSIAAGLAAVWLGIVGARVGTRTARPRRAPGRRRRDPDERPDERGRTQ